MSKLPLIADVLAGLDLDDIGRYVESLEPRELIAALSDWNLWALPYQRLPDGVWRRWVLRGGRGSGKTFAGAKTTNLIARDKSKIGDGEIALVARRWTDAREVMVDGPSGLLKCAPPDFRPTFTPSTGNIRWPNGVKGRIYAAEAGQGVRGPNLSWVWADEVEHWPKNEKVWFESIEFALRRGWSRCMLTSTPIKGSKLLKTLEAKDNTTVTRAATRNNPFLSDTVKRAFYEHYAGTRIGKQELDGEIIDEVAGALWTLDMMQRIEEVPCDLRRIVIAVDPAVSDTERSAEHGIVAAGVGVDGKAYVLADRSRTGSPGQWTSSAVALYRLLSADAIVAEVNQGGDLVEHAIHVIDPMVKVVKVRATRGKIVRAEPIAALYERKKVYHVGNPDHFAALEDQMVNREPGDTEGFDRFDALVWALSDLMLTPTVGPLSAYL